MLIAILIMSILLVINTFLLLLIMLAIYGKINEVVEKVEGPFNSFVKGFKDGLSKNSTPKQ